MKVKLHEQLKELCIETMRLLNILMNQKKIKKEKYYKHIKMKEKFLKELSDQETKAKDLAP